MLGIIPIILSLAFLSYSLSVPFFFNQHNSKELNSESPLPTQVKVIFILKT